MDILDSIYYYDENKDVVISYTWLDSSISDFFDLEWRQYIKASDRSIVLIPMRTVHPELTESRNIISIIYTPLVRNNTVYIVFNLSAEDVNKLK